MESDWGEIYYAAWFEFGICIQVYWGQGYLFAVMNDY